MNLLVSKLEDTAVVHTKTKFTSSSHKCCGTQLLELLEDKLEDLAVVLVAAPSLGRILHNAQGLTLKALDKQDAISKFANVIKKQKQADQAKVRSAINLQNCRQW